MKPWRYPSALGRMLFAERLHAYKVLLAFQYIISRPIQLLGIFGVTLGVWALVVILSIFTGFIQEIRSHLRNATSDLTVRAIEPGIDGEELLRAIADDPDVAACAPRYVWYGMLYPADATTDRRVAGRAEDDATPSPNLLGLDTRFVSVIGIDPVRERAVTGFGSWIGAVDAPDLEVDDPDTLAAAGDGADASWILPSLPRARLEKVRRGSRMVLATGAEQDGTYRSSMLELEVAGAFETQHMGFDGFNTFVHIDRLRRELEARPDEVNEITVRLQDPAKAPEVAVRLTAELNRRFAPLLPVRVRTWEQINALELGAFEHQRGLIRIVLMVILVVAAFLIYATLSMMVTEKTRDIGILTALGGTPAGVSQVFLLCGLVVSGIGAGLGAVLGCLSAVNLERFNQWLRATFDVDLFPASVYFLKAVPYDLDPLWITIVVATALAFGGLAAAIPAVRAASQDPLDALRYE